MTDKERWDSVFSTIESTKAHIKQLETEVVTLRAKAAKWDALAAQMDEFYEEDSEADLGDIGEAAAIAFGYL